MASTATRRMRTLSERAAFTRASGPSWGLSLPMNLKIAQIPSASSTAGLGQLRPPARRPPRNVLSGLSPRPASAPERIAPSGRRFRRKSRAAWVKAEVARASRRVARNTTASVLIEALSSDTISEMAARCLGTGSLPGDHGPERSQPDPLVRIERQGSQVSLATLEGHAFHTGEPLVDALRGPRPRAGGAVVPGRGIVGTPKRLSPVAGTASSP